MDYREKGFDRGCSNSALAPSALEFEASVRMRDPGNHRIAGSKLRECIWLAFKEQQLTCAYPQVDVHVDHPLAESLRLLSDRKASTAA